MISIQAIRVNDKYDFYWRGTPLHVGDVFEITTNTSTWDAEVTEVYDHFEDVRHKGYIRNIGGPHFGLSYTTEIDYAIRSWAD